MAPPCTAIGSADTNGIEHCLPRVVAQTGSQTCRASRGSLAPSHPTPLLTNDLSMTLYVMHAFTFQHLRSNVLYQLPSFQLVLLSTSHSSPSSPPGQRISLPFNLPLSGCVDAVLFVFIPFFLQCSPGMRPTSDRRMREIFARYLLSLMRQLDQIKNLKFQYNGG